MGTGTSTRSFPPHQEPFEKRESKKDVVNVEQQGNVYVIAYLNSEHQKNSKTQQLDHQSISKTQNSREKKKDVHANNPQSEENVHSKIPQSHEKDKSQDQSHHRIRVHHSLIFDLWGESTTDSISGFEVHLIANVKDNQTALHCDYVTISRASNLPTHIKDFVTLDYGLVGKFSFSPEDNPHIEEAVQDYSVDMLRLAFARNSGYGWSNTLNCQQFCRAMLKTEALRKLPYPFAGVGGDNFPILMRYDPVPVDSRNVSSKSWWPSIY